MPPVKIVPQEGISSLRRGRYIAILGSRPTLARGQFGEPLQTHTGQPIYESASPLTGLVCQVIAKAAPLVAAKTVVPHNSLAKGTTVMLDMRRQIIGLVSADFVGHLVRSVEKPTAGVFGLDN